MLEQLTWPNRWLCQQPQISLTTALHPLPPRQTPPSRPGWEREAGQAETAPRAASAQAGPATWDGFAARPPGCPIDSLLAADKSAPRRLTPRSGRPASVRTSSSAGASRTTKKLPSFSSPQVHAAHRKLPCYGALSTPLTKGFFQAPLTKGGWGDLESGYGDL